MIKIRGKELEATWHQLRLLFKQVNIEASPFSFYFLRFCFSQVAGCVCVQIFLDLVIWIMIRFVHTLPNQIPYHLLIMLTPGRPFTHGTALFFCHYNPKLDGLQQDRHIGQVTAIYFYLVLRQGTGRTCKVFKGNRSTGKTVAHFVLFQGTGPTVKTQRKGSKLGHVCSRLGTKYPLLDFEDLSATSAPHTQNTAWKHRLP